MNKENAITLVALVISIIILLILATVSISLVINNGILDKAKTAVDKYSEGEIEEQIKLAYLEYEMARLTNTNLDATTYMKQSLEKMYEINNIEVLNNIGDKNYYYIVFNDTGNIYEYNTINQDIQIVKKFPNKYRFVKIEITKVKEKGMQMVEFNFYNESGNRYKYPSETLITSTLNKDSANESIEKLIDNNVNTKYCSRGWGDNQSGECIITIDLGVNNYIDIDSYLYYAYYTANDTIGRDPISWIISGSYNGSEWITLDTQNDQIITDSRRTKTQEWENNNNF